jgi:hypothetical protein
MKCKICELRKPRRHCPGIHADICSICCGNEREVSISCPLECVYLQEARAHEKHIQVDQAKLANSDVEVTESFLTRHKELMLFIGYSLAEAALKNAGVVDADVREALDSLTRTYRSLSSGLYYDSRPVNPYAAQVYSAMQASIAEIQAEAKKNSGSIRDAELLALLVTYQRLALSMNNGRPKGRSFIDGMLSQFPIQAKEAPAEGRSIDPGRLIEL